MSQAGDTFFTSVGCMDGRVQKPIMEYGQNKFQAIYPDTITEAGLVGLLARPPRKPACWRCGQGKDQPDENLIKSVETKVGISIQKHHSKGVVVHGHQECAGNLVDDNTHKKDVLKTADLIKTFSAVKKNNISVTPVFVTKKEGRWVVEEIRDYLTIDLT